MNILSLYSKIQLKIEKAEEKIKLLSCLDRGLSRKKTAVKTAVETRLIASLLLFYKTLKTIIRFFALLFNDSSENFLMFASEMGYKAKSRDAINRVSTEPAITFVCNNSFCQYKKFQKRVRFYSKTAFAGILICTIITSSVLYFMMPGKDFIKAATYSWNQSDWITGADIAAIATHTLNQTGWSKFYSKDANVNVGTAGEVKLTSTTSTIVDTDDADFNAGTQSTGLAAGGDFYVNSGNLYLKKAVGASCAVDDECVGGINFSSIGCRDSLCGGGFVVIGTQTWMKYNLNVGTKIAGASNQTDNATLEKYCYGDSEANCDTDGGLYQWDEAMGYVTTAGAQGICPSGTHISTDAEQHILDNYLATGTCDVARSGVWDCDPAGTALKVGGSSGFAGIIAGNRETNGSFNNRGTYANFRSSTESSADAWIRTLGSTYSTVTRYPHSKAFGFSVRCLKD